MTETKVINIQIMNLLVIIVEFNALEVIVFDGHDVFHLFLLFFITFSVTFPKYTESLQSG